MSNVQTGAPRTAHDLSHFIFSSGKMGQLQTLSVVPVIAGDSIELDLVGSLRLAQLRRGLAVDSRVDVFSFYIPHRHIYKDEWEQFMKDGFDATPLTQTTSVPIDKSATFLSINQQFSLNYAAEIPAFYFEGYKNIYNNYFKPPWYDDDVRTLSQLSAEESLYGYPCSQLKSIWTTKLPPETDTYKTLDLSVSGATATLNLQDLNAAFGKLNTDQERDFFMQRYRDVMQSFGGYASTDADNRPQLLMRSTFWASGYDVDGTDQASLGQFSGRVQQSFRHRVPRFHCNEHGAIWTIAVVRFPPTHASEVHYFTRNPNLTYEDLAGDPSIVGNMPTKTVDLNEFFSGVQTPIHEFQMPHSQWYRYHPDTVHRNYPAVQGFPFLKDNPTGEQDMLFTNAADYDQMFQTDQLGHWNMQSKNNVTVYRALPNARDSIMTS